ncbi:MAG: SPOR domain-containing protein [Pseudomonadales bacterium]|nr:SPOR domain-containing protein [Pseudomonadales bacterium]
MAAGRTKITSRDYKHARTSGFSFDRIHWPEFSIGLAIGLACAFAVHLHYRGAEGRANEARAAEAPKPEPRRSDAAIDAAATDGEDAAKNLDFYDMLPKFEVVIPEKDKEVSRERGSTLGPIERPGVYVLQAGSYRDLAEAQRVGAQLRLQGIDAQVQRVAVDEDVWHRVRIGPITDLAELNRLRAKLRARELDTLVIRVGE